MNHAHGPCMFLFVHNKDNKTKGMTKTCEKEAKEQREMGKGVGTRTKANSGSMGKRRHGCHAGTDKGHQWPAIGVLIVSRTWNISLAIGCSEFPILSQDFQPNQLYSSLLTFHHHHALCFHYCQHSSPHQ
jgi:hypothetical protein